MRIFFFFFVVCLLSLNSLVFSLRPLSHPCKTLNPNQRTLRSDQITVLINGFSESRIHLLRSIASTYASFPSVDSVLILWGNTTTPLQTLTELSNNLTLYSGAQISVLRQSTQSLNARFIPRPSITTRAIAICDDDVEIDRESFEFAFKIWSTNQDSLIGFFARSHDFDLLKKSWIYTVHHDKYSILLTKFMILNTNYLYKYSCGSSSIGDDDDRKMVKMRNVVDEMMNCEDILMNFVVSSEVSSGPILVNAKKLRDHGDSRNQNEENGEREVGLSSRRKEHRKRRGDCIREFHKVLGRMPLKYSYGKVVNSVGEQGLCEKSGKLVLCDE